MDAIAPIFENLPPPPSRAAGSAPLRRPGSVRRTSTIDMTWPAGRFTPVHMDCRARDIFTPAAWGAPVLIAQDGAKVVVALDRTIQSVETDPPRPNLDRLVGSRGGGYLRAVLEKVMPQARADAEPLYLLLDDLSGASLINGWAWSRWTDDWRVKAEASGTPTGVTRPNVGVCTGFRPGSRAIATETHQPPAHNVTRVPPLPHPDDPEGFHDHPRIGGVSMRRARRIDVWVDDLIRIDATFQDSASAPDGGDRIAVHEYLIEATADPETGNVLSVRADARTLPYPECPAAANNVHRLVGARLHDLRDFVLIELAKTMGCTHLNDALRSMAEAPALLAKRDAMVARN